jgi:DNA gyrase subunit A
LIVVGEGNILTASATGYGKLTPLEEFPSHGRGGQGVIALQTSDRNGTTVAALQVVTGQEIMLISSTGTLVRTPVDEISVLGRNTQGVRLIRLAEGERLTGIERIEHLEGEVVDVAALGATPEQSADLGATPEQGADPAPESPPDSEN